MTLITWMESSTAPALFERYSCQMVAFMFIRGTETLQEGIRHIRVIYSSSKLTSCLLSVLPGRHVQPRSAQQKPRGGDHGRVSAAGHQGVAGLAQTEAQRLPRGRCC